MADRVGSDLRLSEYKGCGMRAFSYQEGSGHWIPQACFWLYAGGGWMRVWTKSFERFFLLQEPAFPSQKQADDFAFSLARRLIDRTLADIEESTATRMAGLTAYVAKMGMSPRRPFSIAKIVARLKNLI